MRFRLLASLLATQSLFSVEIDQPVEKIVYPTPTDAGKHNKLNPALKHKNKPRFIRSRVLSRQHK